MSQLPVHYHSVFSILTFLLDLYSACRYVEVPPLLVPRGFIDQYTLHIYMSRLASLTIKNIDIIFPTNENFL
jgi:hypothetical protein